MFSWSRTTPSPLEVFHEGIAFQPGDEEDAIGGQFLPPVVVGEAFAKDGKRAHGRLQHSGSGNSVRLAFDHIDELGQVTVAIQTDVQRMDTLVKAARAARVPLRPKRA